MGKDRTAAALKAWETRRRREKERKPTEDVGEIVAVIRRTKTGIVVEIPSTSAMETPPTKAMIPATIKTPDPKWQEAGRKAWATRRRRIAEQASRVSV